MSVSFLPIAWSVEEFLLGDFGYSGDVVAAKASVTYIYRLTPLPQPAVVVSDGELHVYECALKWSGRYISVGKWPVL